MANPYSVPIPADSVVLKFKLPHMSKFQSGMKTKGPYEKFFAYVRKQMEKKYHINVDNCPDLNSRDLKLSVSNVAISSADDAYLDKCINVWARKCHQINAHSQRGSFAVGIYKLDGPVASDDVPDGWCYIRKF